MLAGYYCVSQFDLIKGGHYSKTAICNKVFELPNAKDGKQTDSQTARGARTGLYAIPDTTNKALCVKDGYVDYKGKQYPIKLSDGYYIIRKLSVTERKRLQTVPDWYDMSCISNSQAYKCLGNGWTVDVIKHLIKSTLEDSKKS